MLEIPASLDGEEKNTSSELIFVGNSMQGIGDHGEVFTNLLKVIETKALQHTEGYDLHVEPELEQTVQQRGVAGEYDKHHRCPRSSRS